MEQKNIMLSPGCLDMAAGRAGNGKRNFVVLPGLSTVPVSPFAKALADRYGEKFLKDRSLWLVDRHSEVPEHVTIRQMAEDTVKALESAGVTEFELFGASMGGMIALYIASLYPERVKRLVVVSTEGKLREEDRTLFETWKRFAEEKKHTELTQSFYDGVYGNATLEAIRKAGPLKVEPYTDLQLRNFIRCIDALPSLDAYPLCEKITCPVLALGSEGDKVFGTEGVKQIAEKTGGRLRLFGPEYGHAVYDEAPEFIACVREFLESRVMQNDR